jgi:tRNA pseudouridine55 synthase
MALIAETGEDKVLLIDKPYEWTSFDVVRKIRNLLKIKKIGHAGTLDPLATGLLILCTGKQTKMIHTFQELPKAYSGQMLIGKETPSYDLETEFISEKDTTQITMADLLHCAKGFNGTIEQIPPVYSAIKVDGKRAYESARKGRSVELKPRSISIDSFVITAFEENLVSFQLKCSKGTYVRSLVRDFGNCLGCGATLTALRRTAIGNYTVEQAVSMDAFIQEQKRQV